MQPSRSKGMALIDLMFILLSALPRNYGDVFYVPGNHAAISVSSG